MTHDAVTEAMIQDKIAELRGLGYQVTPPPPEPPEPHCALCGQSESDHEEEWGYGLFPVSIEVNPGEEGASYVTRWYCQDDFAKVTQAFVKLGLGSHHHGSTTFIESPEELCGGYGTCRRYDEFDDMREVYRGGPLDAEPA